MGNIRFVIWKGSMPFPYGIVTGSSRLLCQMLRRMPGANARNKPPNLELLVFQLAL